MKQLITTIIVLFCVFFLHGQKNVQKYYQYINKAELAICDFKYEKASKLYEKAFKEHTPFINDLFNAIKLNVKFTKNFSLSLQYSRTLLQRDFEIGWIYSDIAPDDSLIAKQFKILEDTVTSLTDKNLIMVIEEMGVDDQKYRTNYEEYEKNRIIDSVNYFKLIELFSKKGYLTEQNIGIFQSTPIHGILTHTAQHQFNPQNLLLEHVLDGDVYSKLYMKYYDLYMEYLGESTIYYLGWQDIYISNDILFINYPENIAQFNEARKKINMCETWEDYVKKVKYQFLIGNFQLYTIVQRFYEGNEVEQIIQEIDQEHQKGIYKREYIRKEK
jgi:hypothetical protein